MSKRNIVRKIREEEEATAHAFQEFIQTFQTNTIITQSKTFVKSGILHPGNGQEQGDKGQIYNPKPIIKQDPKTVKTAIECARLLKENKGERKQDKQKSNLELLKDELKLRHSAAQEKNKPKSEESSWIRGGTVSEPVDSSTTNLFVANLNQNVTENDLMHLFGTYGPLASIKIMWPRGEDNHRSTNCGFVAFMSRKDGERALNELKHRDDMTVGWAKCVEIPANPVYIPPELLKFCMPPPHTGLPFNAQPMCANQKPGNEEELNGVLYNSTIKVTIPLNKKLLMLIHRMVEYVIREGPLFEAMIMNRELKNPLYQFLFDNKSPLHIYYRWKLYSLMQGENKKKWSTKHFRMFEGGSIWAPPVICDYTEGMPTSLIKNPPKIEKTRLSDSQMNRLVHHVQNLSVHRKSVSDVMIFCLNHQDALNDIMDVLVDSFRNANTKAIKKIARLYLITDVLYNAKSKKFNKTLHIFQTHHQGELLHIFEHLNTTYTNLKHSDDKEEFKCRVLKTLKSWELWSLFPSELISKLESSFVPATKLDADDDYFIDEPLDGANLIKRSLKNGASCTINALSNKDVQIDPRKRQIDYSVFVPSRWETVDPEQIEAQAMSTQKMFHMEKQRQKDSESGTKTLSEEGRERLRKIEIMVIQYREDVEAGKRKLKRGVCLEKELENYRRSLMEKMKKDTLKLNCSPISSESSHSDDDKYEHRRKEGDKSRSKRSTKDAHRSSKKRSRR